MFRRVAIGMSGGVDSAVSGFLLKRKGFHVEGVFMKNWDGLDETGTCSAEKDFEDASNVCKKLNIPLHRVDFIKQYWTDVFSQLLSEYENGLTPNPDILCNRHIKFDSFFKHCIGQLGFDAVATGHYANTSFGPYLEHYNENEGVRLLQPLDKRKDQTFFLSQVKEFALRRCMFPLAHMLKTDVRKIAKSEGLLNVADKRDSTGICFIGKRNFPDFIEEYITPRCGDFIDLDTGHVMGGHRGLHQWTLGQRCNLTGNSKAYFVLKKDCTSNNIYVVGGTDHPALRHRIFYTSAPHWIADEPEDLRSSVLRCLFRFQNVKPLVPCRVMKVDDSLTVILDEHQRAVSPGQFAVFYKDGECLGSAKIQALGPSEYFIKS